MPELKCTVQTCLHNQNYYCDLDSIKVGGSSAKHASFRRCCRVPKRRAGVFLFDRRACIPDDDELSEIDARGERRN